MQNTFFLFSTCLATIVKFAHSRGEKYGKLLEAEGKHICNSLTTIFTRTNVLTSFLQQSCYHKLHFTTNKCIFISDTISILSIFRSVIYFYLSDKYYFLSISI